MSPKAVFRGRQHPPPPAMPRPLSLLQTLSIAAAAVIIVGLVQVALALHTFATSGVTTSSIATSGTRVAPVNPYAELCLELLLLSFLFVALGLTSADFLCPNLTHVARLLRCSDKIAGMTLLALGNSAPDLFSTYIAMNSNLTTLSLGELVGSAFFCVSVVIGLMGCLSPFAVHNRREFVLDLVFFGAFVGLSFWFIVDGRLTIVETVAMMCLYVVYLVWLIRVSSKQDDGHVDIACPGIAGDVEAANFNEDYNIDESEIINDDGTDTIETANLDGISEERHGEVVKSYSFSGKPKSKLATDKREPLNYPETDFDNGTITEITRLLPKKTKSEAISPTYSSLSSANRQFGSQSQISRPKPLRKKYVSSHDFSQLMPRPSITKVTSAKSMNEYMLSPFHLHPSNTHPWPHGVLKRQRQKYSSTSPVLDLNSQIDEDLESLTANTASESTYRNLPQNLKFTLFDLLKPLPKLQSTAVSDSSARSLNGSTGPHFMPSGVETKLLGTRKGCLSDTMLSSRNKDFKPSPLLQSQSEQQGQHKQPVDLPKINCHFEDGDHPRHHCYPHKRTLHEIFDLPQVSPQHLSPILPHNRKTVYEQSLQSEKSSRNGDAHSGGCGGNNYDSDVNYDSDFYDNGDASSYSLESFVSGLLLVHDEDVTFTDMLFPFIGAFKSATSTKEGEHKAPILRKVIFYYLLLANVVPVFLLKLTVPSFDGVVDHLSVKYCIVQRKLFLVQVGATPWLIAVGLLGIEFNLTLKVGLVAAVSMSTLAATYVWLFEVKTAKGVGYLDLEEARENPENDFSANSNDSHNKELFPISGITLLTSPTYCATVSLTGFANSIAWISILSTLVISLLQRIGHLFSISDSLLGLTLFAFGNCIGDLCANIAFAKANRAMTGLGACFGSPLLYILLGVGLNGTIIIVKNSIANGAGGSPRLSDMYISFEISHSLVCSSIGLFVVLGFYLITVPLNGWVFNRKMGTVLIGCWAALTLYNVLYEVLT